jgi:serine/threonine protein kinase/Tol biopolymer transport system component
MMPISPGDRLGPYEIVAPLGAGGMGEVYKARDTRLDRTVAVKVLPPAAADDPVRLRRFEHEARAVAALNHPNICALFDVGSEQSGESPIHFLVMEYLEGDTLSRRLHQGPMPLPLALECGAQIADALARAHRQGIIHRDLKPANIMLLKAGARAGAPQVKLLDFGLARLKPPVPERGTGASSVPTRSAMTLPGTVMGTVPYMAPEQLEGKESDARTDLFAFGSVLYEMLTAQRAFQGASEASVISAILSAEPPPLSSLQPLTPPALDRLVRRCLAKDPDARWQNAADVAEELRGISADSVAAQPARITQPRRRRTWVFAAGALLLVLAAAALVWIAISRLSPSSPVPAHFALTMPGRTVLGPDISAYFAVAADGSGVVYVGVSGGRTRLYWHDLRGPGGWALATTEDGHTPFLSPDARWLGFFRDGKILALPLQSGRVGEGSLVKEIAATDSIRGACWGDDGTIVYGTLGGGLWRVAAGGGHPQRLTEPDRSRNEMDHRWPSLLPGGRHVLFTVQHASSRQERSAIAALSLDTLRITRDVERGVHARYLPSGHLVFGRYGTLLAAPFDVKTSKVTGSPVPVVSDVLFNYALNNFGFDVAADGTLVYANWRAEPASNALVWVTRKGDLEPALPDRRAYDSMNFDLSPDGQRVAVTIEADTFNSIWIGDLRDRRWQRVNIQADSYGPLWSPTGDRLAFSSNRDGPLNLYVVAADGESAPVRLATAAQMQSATSWSPDGRFLAYVQQQVGTPLETYVLPLDGRTAPWRWGPEEAEVTEPAFSPDGRWLAYQSRESGKWEVWVRPFPGPGRGQRVSGRDGGLAPAWSSDGSEIFYLERVKDTRIMSRRVESTSPWRLADPNVAFALPFALDNESAWAARTFAVAPGGRRVLVVQPDERAPRDVTSLTVITNWPEEVKAKLRGGQ